MRRRKRGISGVLLRTGGSAGLENYVCVHIHTCMQMHTLISHKYIHTYLLVYLPTYLQLAYLLTYLLYIHAYEYI